MKGMASAQEFQQAPLPNTYWCVIATAEAQFSKAGVSMIKLTPTIDDTRFPQFKDISCDDYIITDGTAKGGGMGKTKLRGLGIDVDSSDAEMSDDAICSMLQGKGIWVTCGNEQRMTRTGEEGPYNIPMTVVDARTNQQIKLMKLNVKSYSAHNVGQAQAAPVQQNTAPQGAPYAQAPQQHAAPQFAAQQPQQFVQQNPQPGQQFAPAPVPQYAPVPVAQPQFAQQPAQGQPPQGWVAQHQPQQPPAGGFQSAPGFAQPPPQQQAQPAQQNAAPPWAGQPAPNGAPPPAPKKGKKLQLDPAQQDPNAGQPQS